MKTEQKCQFSPNLYIVLTWFQSKSQQDFLLYRQDYLKIYIGKNKGTRIPKIILKKRLTLEIILSDFNSYITTVIKTVWYWERNGSIVYWNTIQYRNRSTPLCTTDFWQTCKSNSVKKRQRFDKWCWSNGTLTEILHLIRILAHNGSWT